MIGQVIDPLAEEGNLHLGGTRVLVVQAVVADHVHLRAVCQSGDLLSIQCPDAGGKSNIRASRKVYPDSSRSHPGAGRGRRGPPPLIRIVVIACPPVGPSAAHTPGPPSWPSPAACGSPPR